MQIMKNICAVYLHEVKTRVCGGDYDLYESHRSGRRTTLDEDLLKETFILLKALSFNAKRQRVNVMLSCSRYHANWKKKMPKRDLSFSHDLSLENRTEHSTICSALLIKNNKKHWLSRN